MHDDNALQAWVLKYDRKVRILTRIVIVQGIALLIAAFVIFNTMYALNYANRYTEFLARNGWVETFRLGEDITVSMGGEDYIWRVIFSQPCDGVGEFVILLQDSRGAWDGGRMFARYTESGGILVENLSSVPPFPFEAWPRTVHAAYYHNNNAIAFIQIDHSLMPPGMYVTLRQWDSNYILQFYNVSSMFGELEQIIYDLISNFIE